MEKDHFSKEKFKSLIDSIEAIVDHDMSDSKVSKGVESVRCL